MGGVRAAFMLAANILGVSPKGEGGEPPFFHSP